MRSRLLAFPALGLLAVVSLAGCGASGSSSSTGSGGGNSCAPVTGQQLVLLQDDKHLQQAENILPVVAKSKSSPALLADLNKVSAVLTSAKLIELNKSTDVDRNTPTATAAQFVKDNNLTSGLQKGSGSILVGTQDFSESQTLGAIYVDVLKAAGFDTGDGAKNAGARPAYGPELIKGNVSVVPEYLGSFTVYLQQKFASGSSSLASGNVQKTLSNLKSLAGKHSLVVGTPAQAQDQNAFAVTDAFSKKYGITTLSQLASKCSGGIVLGGPPECSSNQQPQCEPGLKKTYGMKISKFVPSGTAAGSATVKSYLQSGRVTLGLVLSSDGTLKQAS